MMNEKTEQILAELERIVTERQDWLFRFAYMRIGIREDAEDVVQDALLSVFRRLREKTQMDSVEQYVIRAVSNACTDYFRRKPMQVVTLDKAEQVAVNEGDRQIHEEFLRVSRLLDTLPPEKSEIVRLKCYDELTFKQIAELQGIPEATAKSRYRYAIMDENGFYILINIWDDDEYLPMNWKHMKEMVNGKKTYFKFDESWP